MTAADEFAVRYYRWALDDAYREVEQNFSLLRNVKSALVLRTIGYLESLPIERRAPVAAALVKRFHRKALTLTGESWGAEEERISEAYAAAVRTPRPEEDWYRDALLKDPRTLEIDRARFLARVRADLAPVLGPGEPFAGPYDWQYKTSLGAWTLLTIVDVGGRIHQLDYSHMITAGRTQRLAEGISICSWLGLGGQTSWDQLVEADTPAAARALAQICAHLLPAVSSMIAGLTPAAR